MDVTPLIPEGRQVIERYGDGGFRISGVRFEGSVLLFPDRTLPWGPTSFEEIDRASLDTVIAASGVELLLLGCGSAIRPVPAALRRDLRSAGIVIEPMDTGAACRTYNVLLSEERRVAAALIAV